MLHLLRWRAASFSSPYCGRMTATVDDEEVHIRRDADLAVLTGDGALHGVDGRPRPRSIARLFRQAELVHLQLAALGVRRLRSGCRTACLRRLDRTGFSGSSVQMHATSPGRDEAGHVVNVAVGLIGVDTVPQPDDLLAPQIAAELLLQYPGGSAPGSVPGTAGTSPWSAQCPRPSTWMDPPSSTKSSVR